LETAPSVSILTLPPGRSDFKSGRHDIHGWSITDVAYSKLTPRKGLNALKATPSAAPRAPLDGI
jgi:hypothetical protein